MIPSPLPPRVPNDSFGLGVLIALAWEFNFILIGGFTMFQSRFGGVLFAYWGLIQWLVFVPLYFWQKSKGRPLVGKGILVAGCCGFLLNAGCDFMIGLPLFPHSVATVPAG
jgi:hypothetical protein